MAFSVEQDVKELTNRVIALETALEKVEEKLGFLDSMLTKKVRYDNTRYDDDENPFGVDPIRGLS